MSNIFDLLRRDGDSSNTIIGIILLFMLLVFIGPDTLPQLVSNTLPFIDEGIPCTYLRTAENRGQHQSLIGRSAVNPLILSVEVDTLPTNPANNWVIRIIVVNNTIGTVPFVFDERQVIIGNDPASSGIGLIFNPAIGLNLGTSRQNAGAVTFPENTIRLLGPRQRCVHRIVVPGAQAVAVPAGTTVSAYYRITNAGAVQQINAFATPIFQDQGLAIISGGFIQSDPVTVPISTIANNAQG